MQISTRNNIHYRKLNITNVAGGFEQKFP